MKTFSQHQTWQPTRQVRAAACKLLTVSLHHITDFPSWPINEYSSLNWGYISDLQQTVTFLFFLKVFWKCKPTHRINVSFLLNYSLTYKTKLIHYGSKGVRGLAVSIVLLLCDPLISLPSASASSRSLSLSQEHVRHLAAFAVILPLSLGSLE